MAKKIDKVPVKAGRLVRVWNTNRPKFSNASKQYYAIWVENALGDDERCLLMTEQELQRMQRRASRNKEDLTEKSFFTDLMD